MIWLWSALAYLVLGILIMNLSWHFDSETRQWLGAEAVIVMGLLWPAPVMVYMWHLGGWCATKVAPSGPIKALARLYGWKPNPYDRKPS